MQHSQQHVHKLLRVADEPHVATRELDEFRAQALGQRRRGPLGELAPRSYPPGDDESTGRRLQGGDVGLVERDGQQTMSEESIGRRHLLG